MSEKKLLFLICITGAFLLGIITASISDALAEEFEESKLFGCEQNKCKVSWPLDCEYTTLWMNCSMVQGGDCIATYCEPRVE